MATSEPSEGQKNTWREFVVPTAKALERFFWNLVWFLVLMCFLFSYNPFSKDDIHENRTQTNVEHQTLPEQPEGQRWVR